MGSRDLPLHRGDVADAVSKLEIRRRAGDATLDQPVGEGRRVDDLRRVGGVEGVEHHLIVEGDDPDDLHVHRQVRLGLEGGGPPGAVAGQRRLGIGVEADRDHLAHVQAQRLGHDRRHHDLIGPLRVGQSPRYRSETVLIGELAVDAAVVVENADAEGVSLGGRGERISVPPERLGIDVVLVLDRPHEGQAEEARAGPRVGAGAVGGSRLPVRSRNEQGRRVGAGQKGGVRGLGAPGRGDRADGQTAQQRDQEDDSQVAGPPATECGPETVRGDTKDGAHVTNRVRAATDGRSPRSPTSRNPQGGRRCGAVTRGYDHGERIEEGAPQLDSRRGTDPRTWEPCPSCDSQRTVPPIAPNRSAILMYP